MQWQTRGDSQASPPVLPWGQGPLGPYPSRPTPACLSLSRMPTPQSPGQARRFLPPHPPGRSALTFPIHKQFIEESQIFDFPETNKLPLP